MKNSNINLNPPYPDPHSIYGSQGPSISSDDEVASSSAVAFRFLHALQNQLQDALQAVQDGAKKGNMKMKS